MRIVSSPPSRYTSPVFPSPVHFPPFESVWAMGRRRKRCTITAIIFGPSKTGEPTKAIGLPSDGRQGSKSLTR